jgi:hypothetical protein
MISINVDTLDGIFNLSYIIAEAHYDSDEEDGDLPEASCKEESRYSEKVMAETTIREDEVGMVDLSDSL